MNATPSTRNARFQRGSGVYVCRCCGHNTRDTGGDGSGVQLCDICFELAGEQNHLSDNGELYSVIGAGQLVAQLDKRNGAGTAERVFPEVFAALNPVVTPPAAPAAASVVAEPAGLPINTPSVRVTPSGNWYTQHFTLAKALTRIRTLSKGRTVYLQVNQQGMTSDTKYFPVMGNIQVPRKAAMKWVADAYAGFDTRGVTVRLMWCDGCLFIG